MRLSLRARMTLWFSLVLGLSLALFGGLTYTSMRNELKTNLDVSLNKVISGLDVIIRQQAEQAALKPPSGSDYRRRRPTRSKATADTAKDELAFLRKDSLSADSTIKPAIKPLKAEAEKAAQNPGRTNEVDPIWTAIYEHILLTPRNFMIQVMDSAGNIVFRSDNLGTDSIEVPATLVNQAKDSVAQFATITQQVPWREGESAEVRLAIARSRSALIVAAYPSDEVQSLLEQFFGTLTLLAPVVLLLSTIGGWFLAKASLRPIDEITTTAQDITASNLSRRLPVATTKDEIGRLSETLNDMISRLEMSFERIRQFTADASHELRTPLTILTGELELALRTRKTAEEYQSVLSSALQEVLRLSHVVESLLLLSRSDMGHVQLHREPTNLTETLADLADAATILGTQKNIYITFRPAEDLYVFADRAKLYQMFLNLVDNAVKYTASGGMISISVHREKEWAEVHVRDTGIGISPEHRKKIFDRFYRVDKARSRELGGAGLGLAIVQWIVEIHGGTISVESEPGKGSTFIVRLPLYREVTATPQPIEQKKASSPFDVGRFLRGGKAEKGEKGEERVATKEKG